MVNENSNKNFSVRKKTHDSVDKIIDKAENIGEKSKEIFNTMKEKGIKMKDNADSYIKKNPEKSVMIAAGMGAVIGMIFTFVMMRKRH